MEPESLHAVAADIMAHEGDRVKAFLDLRRWVFSQHPELKALKMRHAKGKLDYSLVRGLDDIASELAGNPAFAEAFPSHKSPEEALYDVLVGDRPAVDVHEAYRQAAEQMFAHQVRQEVASDVKEEIQSGTSQAVVEEVVRQGENEAFREAAKTQDAQANEARTFFSPRAANGATAEQGNLIDAAERGGVYGTADTNAGFVKGGGGQPTGPLFEPNRPAGRRELNERQHGKLAADATERAPVDQQDHGPLFRGDLEGRQPGDVAKDVPDPWDEAAKTSVVGRIVKMGLDFKNNEDAHLWLPDIDTIKDFVRQRWQAVKVAAQHFNDHWATFAGEQAPITTRLDRATGEKAVRHASVKMHAELLTPEMVERTLGKDATEVDAKRYGTAATEMHLRQTRAYYEDVAKNYVYNKFNTKAQNDARTARVRAMAQAKAGFVKQVIGFPESAFPTEAEYLAFVKDQMPDFIKRWNEPGSMREIMEENFRKSQGLADTDPIDAKTQVPGFPMNLKGMKEGEQAQAPGALKAMGGGGGNIRRGLKLGKNRFANQRSGDADYYDIDMREIIKNSLYHGLHHATKADWIRTGVEGGVFSWDRDHLFDGAKGREVPYVKPAPGTQQAKMGQETLYVAPDAYNETRQILAVDQAKSIPGFTAMAPWLIRASLASTVELAYHSKNLLTFLMKPGVRPTDVIKNAWGVIKDNKDITQRIIDLAEIGAMKTHGLESDPGVGSKYNPLHWGGKFLDLMQKVMRLSAEDAFDRLKRQGSALGTETNKRDFISQLGQYNKLTQNRLIVMLRDTQLGPFATAGSNYLVQGLRSLTLNPGAEATGLRGNLLMKAEMLAKVAGVLTATAIANHLLWGRLDGDDKTPLGAIKAGVTADGKTRSFDLMSLTGMTRGLRATGLMAFMEGSRTGQTRGQMLDRARDNFVDSLLHPAEGPAVSFLHTAITGRNSIGMSLAEKVHHGKNRTEGESQAWNDVQAALWNANPVVATLTGRSRLQDQSAEEKFSQLLGPYGFKYKGAPKKPHGGLYGGRSGARTGRQS